MQSRTAKIKRKARDASETFTVRVGPEIKKRLASLAASTGRSRSFLTAEAIAEYLDANEWQVAGIRKALTSLDRGASVEQGDVRRWIESWGTPDEIRRP
ncbi:CopG family ribbon-helix-helix protein [Methylocystis sp. B8]|uniref:CopG family ribbon-helix-helix protein n=1 Tax=Methylocystis sp. B8 TaxID=544938 RepID=UPI0010FCF24E|nr:CopG family ribbon-helix-helix protein [Methylocystis sp. B8]TLG78925.1 ribbon-helix-helix protein, CopG family [Methylocystis sp. B8]